MEPPSGLDRPLSSAEKKRARDRRAQRNLREKRNKSIETLTHQIALCKRLHNPYYVERLLQTCFALQAENKILRDRQNELQSLLQAWGPLPPAIDIPQPGSLTDDDDGNHSDNSSDLTSTHDAISPRKDIAGFNVTRPNSSMPTSQMSAALSAGGLPHSTNMAESQATEHAGVESFFGKVTIPWASGTFLPEMFMASAGDSLPGLLEATWMPAAQDLHQAPSTFFESIGNDCYSGLALLTPSCAELRDKHTSSRERTSSGLAEPGLSPSTFSTSMTSLPAMSGSKILGALDTPAQPMSPWLELPTTTAPIWKSVPLSICRTELLTKYAPWAKDITQITLAPDLPSVQDLVFDPSENMLATSIRACLQAWNFAGPESVAAGWLIYSFVKWSIDPTAERFARIPATLRPTSTQLEVAHDSFLDLIVWPAVRVNIIKNQQRYNMAEVLALFAESLKVRWPKDEDYLELNSNAELVVRQKFIDNFLDEGGWVLCSKFVKEYPQLAKGLPVDRIV
ncbi:hypothetical protein BKA56DRAFT_578631 [Ilyonectria sp. MPI-CAGE-AT-0026]|nr:hypothetical protein BKA56DRAFT_578631 [Ilyonectria sp. MPI-CAGE-AT-0026]